MLIGYMRVSTGEQNLDLQRDALERAGCERIYDDVCSGRATDRPGLAKALNVARDGDALVVWKLDRIGRSLTHVVGLVSDLQKRGVGLKVLTGDVDTTTATGRLVFGIFATLAEFERDLIHERTMAGLAAARARGRAGGRPRVMTKQKLKAAMAMMADRDNAARDVAAHSGCRYRRSMPTSTPQASHGNRRRNSSANGRRGPPRGRSRPDRCRSGSTDSETREYGRSPANPHRTDPPPFPPDDMDREFVAEHRGDHNRLG